MKGHREAFALPTESMHEGRSRRMECRGTKTAGNQNGAKHPGTGREPHKGEN